MKTRPIVLLVCGFVLFVGGFIVWIMRQQVAPMSDRDKTSVLYNATTQSVSNTRGKIGNLQAMELTSQTETPPAESLRGDARHYVLDLENPISKLVLSNSITQNLLFYESIIRTEYDPVFERLGLDDETQEGLRTHLRSIQKARVQIENYLIQLDRAKNAFDRRMRSTLTEDQYLAYRNEEAARPATRRVAAMKEHLRTAGVEALSEDLCRSGKLTGFCSAKLTRW
jgi:hypothetical protein